MHIISHAAKEMFRSIGNRYMDYNGHTRSYFGRNFLA